MSTHAPGPRVLPRRTRAVIVAAAITVAAGAGLTGCASAQAGFGLPSLREDVAVAVIEDAGGTAAPVAGTLAVESNGCFTWRSPDGAEADGAWVVWPDGFRQDDDEVVTDTGDRLGGGDAIEATGSVVALEDLPDSGRDGYFGSFGRFCDAEARGVLVLTTFSHT